MGQGQSAEVEVTPKIRAIQTKDDLVNRYQCSIPAMCLNSQERGSLTTVFHKFSVTHNEQRVWTESGLSRALSLLLAGESRPVFQAAVPILYHWMLHLGSFPYLQNSAPALSFQVFQQAMILIFRRYEYKLHSLGEEDSSRKHELQSRRIFFQSLATIPSNGAEMLSQDRTEENDEDLLLAYKWVENHNYIRIGVKQIKRGPPLPPVKHFPTSNSKSTVGYIPYSMMKILLRLLLVSALYGIVDPDSCSKDGQRLEEIVSSTMAAFSEYQKTSGEINWNTFNSVIDHTLPNLFQSLTRIFAPLLKLTYSEIVQLHPTPSPETAPILPQRFLNVSKLPINSSILSIPLLSQLSLFLPDISSQIPTSLYSSQEFQMPSIKQALSTTTSPKAKLLLIPGDSDLGLGIYYDTDQFPREEIETLSEEEYETLKNKQFIRPQIIFQYQPILQVSRSLPPSKLHSPSNLQKSPDSEEFIQEINTGFGIVTLFLNEGSRKGRVSVSKRVDGTGSGYLPGEDMQEFKISYLEVVELRDVEEGDSSLFRVDRIFNLTD